MFSKNTTAVRKGGMFFNFIFNPENKGTKTPFLLAKTIYCTSREKWKSDTCFIAKLLSLLRKDEEQLRQSRGSQPTTTDPEGIRFGVLR